MKVLVCMEEMIDMQYHDPTIAFEDSKADGSYGAN